MKHILEPLSHIPGVRVLAMVTPDGVPITVQCSQPDRRKAPRAKTDAGGAENRRGMELGGSAPEASPSAGERSLESSEDMEALAALATAWIGEINRAVAPLSWDAPRRLVLRAARGTLILQQAPGALLLAVLDGGLSAEDLRLPMDGAIARMQRHLKSLGAKIGEPAIVDRQPSILPSRPDARGSNAVSPTGNEVPEVSGE